MDAEQFYNYYINKLSIQIKYRKKDKRALLFEVMEEYVKYKNK
tara:strand:- start:222 stop:350 length:129 start_codon:yes stop_codon:yes gene_type:complete